MPDILRHGDAKDFIKRLVLGYLIKQSIAQNNAHQITTGVEIRDLQSGKAIISHNVDTQQFAASVNKLPVALLVLEDLRSRKLLMEQEIAWEASDVRAGAGVYDQPGAPTKALVKDILYDMLNRSGNTAVRIFVNRAFGGAAAVNERWAQIPQLSNTRLQPLDANRFYVGNSTPRDAIWTIEQLLKQPDTYSAFIKDTLSTNIYTGVSVRSQLAGNDYIVLANKVGLLDDVEGNNRHDVGIIYNTKTKKSYSFAFFTTSPYESAEALARAETSLKEMGRYTLRFSGDKKQHTEAALLNSETIHALTEKRTLY